MPGLIVSDKPEPEGVSVIVVSEEALSRSDIAFVAGQVASDLYPDRVFGPVLWVEECSDGYEVVVSDLGAGGARV